ncbi:MAG: 30S ribosomal protein S16, partial [Aeriscardovia sp.]|nr:30S ribosomal protein S16 [Aeriscardovia sp.]
MSTRIRLKRTGKIHDPQYRVVVVDQRKKRDGKVIEEVGYYNPNPNPSLIHIDSEKVQRWLAVGAQPSDPVRPVFADPASFTFLIPLAEVDNRLSPFPRFNPKTYFLLSHLTWVLQL